MNSVEENAGESFEMLCDDEWRKTFDETLLHGVNELEKLRKKIEDRMHTIEEIQRIITALPCSYEDPYRGENGPFCTLLSSNTIIKEKDGDKHVQWGALVLPRSFVSGDGASARSIRIIDRFDEIKQERCPDCSDLHPLIRVHEHIKNAPSDNIWETAYLTICPVSVSIHEIAVEHLSD